MLKEKKFEHLQPYERDNIAILKAKGESNRSIAKKLGRSPSTISRELKRGVTQNGCYYPNASQSVIDNKKKRARRKRKTDDPKVQKYIKEKLENFWSPEIISAKIEEDLEISVCTDSIYAFIYENPELTKYLTRKHPAKKPRKKKKTEKTLIPNRTGIEDRPNEANNREEFGHFEADTIVSRASLACLLVIVDRMTRKIKIKKLARKKADLASSSILFALKEYNISTLLSITYDNGSEFCAHEKVNEALKMKSFFCNPYSSWEKGTVENMNGLIRRFFPKGTDFAKITEEKIQQVEDWINNRPMKILEYKSPNEKYANLQKSLSVAI